MSGSEPTSQPNFVAVRQQLHAYVDFLRDLGIHDLYHRGDPKIILPEWLRSKPVMAAPLVQGKADAFRGSAQAATPAQRQVSNYPAASLGSIRVSAVRQHLPAQGFSSTGEGMGPAADGSFPRTEGSPFMAKPPSLDVLAPIPVRIVPAAERPAALQAVRAAIGECTRCPLAYAGRRHIVFADGDPNARLMFVGEGPGADEDASGVPFVGKAGQLLNNMIAAMGLKREEVYIANIVKCRPPGNRTPEFVEATTCSPFLLQQIDIVHPEVIVALGLTAASYLLGVKQSLASMRGRWQSVRGAKVMVTYHPAYLLRDPRQKAEAWKDLKLVMTEMGLTPPQRPS